MHNLKFVLVCMFLVPACASVPQHDSRMATVITQLKSSEPSIAEEGVRNALSLGSVVLPALTKLRGERGPFRGNVLGHPMSAQITFLEPAEVEHEHIVSVEVAALYLIEAIYRGNLHFAQSAYLTDLTLPEEVRTAANSSDRVNRAWNAAEAWIKRLDTMTLDEARQRRDGPLSGSGVQFW